MKICVVALDVVPYLQRRPDAVYGGAEVQAAVLAHAFSMNGAEVTLLVKDFDQTTPLSLRTENAYFSSEGLPGVRLFSHRLPGLLRALKRVDADLYYQHCAGMITGVTSFFCRLHGKKFVYGAGSNSDFTLRGSRVPGIRDKLFYYYGLKLSSGVVAQNYHQFESCKNRLKQPVKVIPMMTDVQAEEGISSGKKIVWVGALRPVKNPALFLQLAKLFPDREFVMIGGEVSTQVQYAEAIRARAEKIPNVTCTGRIPNAEVIQHLRSAALLLNTSSVEGFPNVYLEAWKCAVPILTFTDVDGLIEQHRVGIVCSDIQDMGKNLKAIIDDETERQAMGKRARELVRSNYSPEALTPKFMEFFHQLLAERN
jgi:glycosyltransferase involved in cell wall biosynthesis